MKLSCFVLFACYSMFVTSQDIPLYVGTYTNTSSKGVYCLPFNTITGKLGSQKLVAELSNPSFLAYSSNRKYVYALSEVNNFDKNKSGIVTAYSVEKNSALHFINKVSTNGAHPCHIEIDHEKVAISNYTGGSVSLHHIDQDGGIKPAFQIINHNTSTEQSHAHSAQFYKNDLFIADLGRNFLAEYQLKESKSSNYFFKTSHSIKNNGGPRHFEISKSGKFIYIINELNSSITVLKKENRNYQKIGNISTLKDDFTGESFCADIHLSNDEQFLYGSNRGENSIVVFKIDSKNGLLKKIQSVDVRGNWPRNFALSPDGQFLLVANQKSENISVFSRDNKSGKLSFLYSQEMATPVCLLF